MHNTVEKMLNQKTCKKFLKPTQEKILNSFLSNGCTGR